LALKINIFREMAFNFTLVGTTTWTSAEPYRPLHNYLWPTTNWNCLNSCRVVGEVQDFLLIQYIYAYNNVTITFSPHFKCLI